jgi:hypothetical protein
MTATVQRVLRSFAVGVGAVVLVAGCAGIRPAPVLPIDPIYQPDTTPKPSDAPLIEASPSAPAAGPDAQGRDASAGAARDGGLPGPAAAQVPSDRAGPEPASSPETGLAPPPNAAPGSANANPAPNRPERVALAPPNIPSPLAPGGGAAAAPAQGGAAAANVTAEAAEDVQFVKLLSDLERYGSFTGEELKRELASATAALARQHTDSNRIRAGVLYSLARTSTQDDQRALQLFETVAKDAPASSPMRHLAVILQTQVLERQRAVKFEQQKGDAAIQKLEALRAMEQSLFRDRIRGGGGGGGGAGGSGR